MTGALVLITLGILLLLNNLYPEVYRFGRMWPLILIVIGISKVLGSISNGGGGAPPRKDSE